MAACDSPNGVQIVTNPWCSRTVPTHCRKAGSGKRMAVLMRDVRDPLNVLCPAHEIEPQFAGGIRLERNVWLAGFPPRIRLTGELGSDFQVLIDGQSAQLASDGALESTGWDTEGQHRL